MGQHWVRIHRMYERCYGTFTCPFLFFPKTALYIQLWKPVNVLFVCIIRQWTHTSHLTRQRIYSEFKNAFFWKIKSWFSKYCRKKSSPPYFFSKKSLRPPFFDIFDMFLQRDRGIFLWESTNLTEFKEWGHAKNANIERSPILRARRAGNTADSIRDREAEEGLE